MFSCWENKLQYDKEEKQLFKSRKNDMSSDLYGLIENLREKEDISEFIKSKIDSKEKEKVFYSDLKSKDNILTSFFYVKIIGFLFLASNIIGIFQLIGIKESLEDEALDSIKLYFNGNTTNTTINNTLNFYQKVYSNNAKYLPRLSFFLLLPFYMV